MTEVREKIIDFTILALRWYLAFYMIDYGWGKVTMSQFGVHDEAILQTPLEEVDTFYVAWYLYGKSLFFNYTTGIAEIVGGILLLFHRTALLGTLLILTILGQILIIDIAFTTSQQGFALPTRILGMILSALSILYHYKDRLVKVFNQLTRGVSTKFKYSWWVYLLLPIIGFLLDFVIGLLMLPVRWGLENLFLVN